MQIQKKEELERKRRDAFYERNGVIKTALVSSVYDANYRVWYLGCKRNDVISTLELKKMYDDIYRFMLSKKGFEERYKVDIEDNSR